MYGRRFFSVVSLMVVFIMLLSACGTPAAAPAGEGKELTIAGVVFQDDQFMKTLAQGYKDAGAKYGIKIVTANTNNDQAKETELVQTYIAQGVSGIAIYPLSKDASPENLKQAASKGIKVVVAGTVLEDTSYLTGTYASDDATNGKIVGSAAAKFIKENIKGDVNIARLDFDPQLPEMSKSRWSGFYAGLDEAGVAYKEVAKTSAWLQDTALAATMDMLTANPDINIIFASNDGSTIGATQAVKQAGLQGKVFVFGYDGGDQQTSDILSGDNILIAVVAQDPYTQGYKAVESLALTLQGKENPDEGKVIIVPGTYLGADDPAVVNAWRKANGLK